MAIDSKLFDQILSGNVGSGSAPNAEMAGNAVTDIIRGAADRYGVDPEVMISLAKRESSLNPTARNPQSSAGGLFQFIDGTWKDYGNGGDKFDPAANADAAARMLRDNLNRFGGNYDAALAAHHVGPGKALAALSDASIGDVNTSTQKWLAQIKGERQLRDDLKAQRRDARFAEDRPDYNPGFGGEARPAAGGRSGFELVKDSGAALLKGVGHLGESMGGLYGLLTGDTDPNMAQTGGAALADFAESLKSDFIKNQEQLNQQDIDAADGHFNKFVAAAGGVLTNPALFANVILEQGINFVPGMATGRIAKGLMTGLGGVSAAAIEAAPTAQKAMLMKRLATAGQVGTGVSVVTGAVLQGADAGNSAYQQIQARPQAEWDADPEYQRLVTTLGANGAKDKIALDESRAAFLKSAGISTLLNAAAPTHSIDSLLVNGIKNRVLPEASRAVAQKLAGQGALRAVAAGAGKGFAGESLSEGIDEGYGQYVANEAEARINPNKDMLDQVAENAGLGAVFGPVGAVTGGIEGHQRRQLAQTAMAAAPAPHEVPNSPLSRAAHAAAPAVAAQQQEAGQAVAVDPLDDALAAIDARITDRSFYDAVRQHPNLGPDALSDILGSFRVATNTNLELPQRQAAIERLGEFFQAFDNQPNFTFGNGQVEAGGPVVPFSGERGQAQPDIPTYDVGAHAQLGQRYPQLTEQDQQVVDAATAEYEAAYQDLVKAEQLGAGDQELMQRQIAMREAEARLTEIHQAIEGNRQQDSAAKRDALLGHVLDVIPPGQNPNRAFDRALKAAGFNDTNFSEAERAKIAQWQQLSDAFQAEQAAQEMPTEAGTPNQMGAEAMGIKARREPQAAGQPGASIRKVDAMLDAGMQRRGDQMFDPSTGQSVKLSPAQIARAKHVEKTAERERVLPAYQAAVAQRIAELQQLVADPAHDEDKAVRLSRAITGLNGMIAQLQGGASLDTAIAKVFGSVPADAAAALKSPQLVTASSEQVASVVPAQKQRSARLTPLEDARIAKYADDLKSMAPESGWAEEGGKLLRDENDNVIGRTRWVPRAEWFMRGMLNHPKESVEAVRKAIAGEPMYKPEKLHVAGMMDFLDRVHEQDVEADAAQAQFADAISEDSDFGLPDYAFEKAAVIELEFANGAIDVPDFLDAIGANDEEQTDVAENEEGDGRAGGAAGSQAQEGGGARQDDAGAGRAGQQSEGFGLTQQTNEQAAAAHAQQQAADADQISKEQADKERDAVPFSLAQQSQPKPQGMQSGLFTADGRPTVAAKQPEAPTAKPFDEKARDAEREKFKAELFEQVRTGKVALAEGQNRMAEFDKQTKALREGAAQSQPKNDAPAKADESKGSAITGESGKNEPTAAEKAAVKEFLTPGQAVTQGGWIGVVRDKSIPHPRDGHQFDNPENGWYLAMHDTDGRQRRGSNKDRDTSSFFVRDGVLYEGDHWSGSARKLDVHASLADAVAAVNAKQDQNRIKNEDAGTAKDSAESIDQDQEAIKNAEAENATVAAKNEAKPEYDAEKLRKDFALFNVKISEALLDRGDIGKLYKAAGLRGADKFGNLPMSEQSAAYVKAVQGGMTPVEITENYNDMVSRMERDAIVRRLQSDATVRQENGKPFKSAASANAYQDKYDLGDTHEVAATDGGFELKRLGAANRPSAIKAMQDRQAADPEMQRQEAAFAKAREIGAAADSLVEKYENGDIEIEDFESGLASLTAETAGQTSEMDDIKAKLGQAFDELASILGVKKNLTPEEESALLPVMAKIFRLAAKAGFIKFKEAARFVLDLLREHNPAVAEKLSIDNLQSGYINIAKEIGGDKRGALDIDSIADLYADDALRDRIESAEQATNHDATPGQKEAGNYAKGKFPWNGLTISVETAKGEDRTDKETNGDKWRVTLPATYGYILRTEGADGDHVDAFMGPHPESDQVFIINQTKPGSEAFDEHKTMLGYADAEAAKADYLASFADGFGNKVFGSMQGPFEVAEFKQMLADGELTKAAPIDAGRQVSARKALADITVTLEATEAETGRAVEIDESADAALKDVDDRMNLARRLLECLAS